MRQRFAVGVSSNESETKANKLKGRIMRRKSFQGIPIITLAVLSLFVFSCKDELMVEEKDDSQPEVAALETKAGNIDLPGRLLASNCFQCHGTNGYAGELKIGEQSASSIISDMNEMRTKNPGSNIMNVHARAYTTEEIKLIANYISQQSKY